MQQQMFKHVTNRQAVQLADKAREFGISREEFAVFLSDEEKLQNFFQNLQSVNIWFENLKKEAEKIGARLHLIENLVVDYSIPHNQAAMLGGPQTGYDFDVLKVGDLYQPDKKIITETIVLLNYPKGGGNYKITVSWGMENGLLKTTPHVPFFIRENFPSLNYKLGLKLMYLVETTGCVFHGNNVACFVWWDDSKYQSDVRWARRFGHAFGWFAFRKPELITK